tara:strand:- start:572 stop:1876 length:1305 start_codon:yes stop_codon:yes gene_type:complete
MAKRKITARNKRTTNLSDPNVGNRKGACCMPSGDCKAKHTKDLCQSRGGEWMGADSYCTDEYPRPNNGVNCKNKRTTNIRGKSQKIGSCCYYDKNENRAICKNGFTVQQCREKNKGSENHWSILPCDARITKKDDLCCNNCGENSLNPDTRNKLAKARKSKKTFRSRINENVTNYSPSKNKKCNTEVSKKYYSLYKNISHTLPEILSNEMKDVINLIKMVGLEKCEVCSNRTSERITTQLRSYYGCLCRLDREKEEKLISTFEEYKHSLTGTEETQDDLQLHQKIDEIIFEFRDRETACRNIMSDDNTNQKKSEDEIGCCCQYMQTGRSDGPYNQGDLRRCSSLTERECSVVRKYKTDWVKCEECEKTCVSGNKPGKCGSCPGNTTRASSGAASTTTTSTSTTTPSSAPASAPASPPPSSPSSPPSSPSYGSGY